MDLKNFVYVKEKVFSKEFCDNLIKDFESVSDLHNVGQSGSGVNHDIKNSFDIDLMDFEMFEKYVTEICDGFNMVVKESLDSLPFQNRFEPYHFMLVNNDTTYYNLQMQKYDMGKGHYNGYHWEADTLKNSIRQFVFILYLNDVEKGGETEILYGQQFITPKAGSVLCHPAGFPFVHRGLVPESSDKYIVTTWLNFS